MGGGMQHGRYAEEKWEGLVIPPSFKILSVVVYYMM